MSIPGQQHDPTDIPVQPTQVPDLSDSDTDRLRALEAELAGLREAMATRAVIEQAKGIVMAREGCDADEAFEILVRLSQRQHRKLRDLARDITVRVVERRRLKSV